MAPTRFYPVRNAGEGEYVDISGGNALRDEAERAVEKMDDPTHPMHGWHQTNRVVRIGEFRLVEVR